jgi:hypothetical protein
VSSKFAHAEAESRRYYLQVDPLCLENDTMRCRRLVPDSSANWAHTGRNAVNEAVVEGAEKCTPRLQYSADVCGTPIFMESMSSGQTLTES